MKFPSGVEVKEGNELTPTQVKDIPTVQYEADPDKFYTLAMTGKLYMHNKLIINNANFTIPTC